MLRECEGGYVRKTLIRLGGRGGPALSLRAARARAKCLALEALTCGGANTHKRFGLAEAGAPGSRRAVRYLAGTLSPPRFPLRVLLRNLGEDLGALGQTPLPSDR